MQNNNNLFDTGMVITFAAVSWSGNMFDWSAFDSAILSPVMHAMQIAAAAVAIATFIRQVTRKKK